MVMDKTRDSAIKLFGKTIPVGVSGFDGGGGGGHIHECLREAESIHEEEEEDDSEQSPSKRDRRILPCPRCSSSDTKFCYFNNSNPNQPRHYCKNCQRYWTAGGTMRNVPVGSGRRKAKRTASPARTDAKAVSFISISNQMEAPEENCDEQSSGSSVVTASSCTDWGTGFDPQPAEIGSHQEIPTQIPYLIGSPWPYPSPAFYNSSFPVPVMYPAPAYWGCAAAIPWFAPIPPPATTNSTTLGKHPREQDVMKDRDSEKGCLWAPKTTRIGDLEEAAKISIWSGLGFKNDIKSQRADCFSVLHANPAALSRSLNFQESS